MIGGSTGDLLMHSLDTVKTRQQGAPTVPKYFNMTSAYRTLLREEGVLRGLYAGIKPAMLGSIPGTAIFFGTYECSKRNLIALGIPETLSHLTAGLLGDLFASSLYVPSEVLKTRLQLQGRYSNPHFSSGYNYRSTLDAIRTIYREEGRSAFFHGYKATLVRDLPFSALQFAFYERFKVWARQYYGSHETGLFGEILTGSAAGALSGALTTPLDVVKTRIQTQKPPEPASEAIKASGNHPPSSSLPKTRGGSPPHALQFRALSPTHVRLISTSYNTSVPSPGSYTLTTSSVVEGMRRIYRMEGLAGLFRGIGPRTAWTGAQSSIMFVVYETLLRRFARIEHGQEAAS
ncbi:putative mitochondrial carrier protein [Protomyces lactucae-debilis]|uniref:Putative mitochondrial carrier protein n=1 Tax=Protomyces lactucae-debilis TaxID=2754530 RepID=A0A1Y2FRM9_PROLT|nr:putative mitochondrial carrier protein [Protomyces lactucae-debilis]ORY86237.1 putative mitochondrial carrier protein [Protomyces lactucae-debilis]